MITRAVALTNEKYSVIIRRAGLNYALLIASSAAEVTHSAKTECSYMQVVDTAGNLDPYSKGKAAVSEALRIHS